MGFTEVLTIVFIVLKLMGIINWSWWLVLLPEIIVIVFGVFWLVTTCISDTKRLKKRLRTWE